MFEVGKWYNTSDGFRVEFIKTIEEDGMYNVFRHDEAHDFKAYYTDTNGKTAYGPYIIIEEGMLYICPRAKDCIRLKCVHKKPHTHKLGCTLVIKGCPPCVPYKEERVIYHGGCHGCKTDQSQCPKCQYYKPDWTKPNLWSKKEKPMFKVGDRVKVINVDRISNNIVNLFKNKVLPIVSIFRDLYYLESEGRTQCFREEQIELIKEKSMTEYKVIKEFTKADYIVAHQKKYGWESFKSSCAEFQEDMAKHRDEHIWRKEIIIHDGCYSSNFWTHAVKFGFMEVVEEEKELFVYMSSPNEPVLRIGKKGEVSRNNGDIIIDCSLLTEDRYFDVNLKHANYTILADRIKFTLKD